jgi:hypothetical protein
VRAWRTTTRRARGPRAGQRALPLELLADEGLVGFGKSVKRVSLYSWMSPAEAVASSAWLELVRWVVRSRSACSHADYGSRECARDSNAQVKHPPASPVSPADAMTCARSAETSSEPARFSCDSSESGRKRDDDLLEELELGLDRSGSPTSMSTTRLPPKAVCRSTMPSGSSDTRPTDAASAPSGCDRRMASASTARSSVTTAMSRPSLAT